MQRIIKKLDPAKGYFGILVPKRGCGASLPTRTNVNFVARWYWEINWFRHMLKLGWNFVFVVAYLVALPLLGEECSTTTKDAVEMNLRAHTCSEEQQIYISGLVFGYGTGSPSQPTNNRGISPIAIRAVEDGKCWATIAIERFNPPVDDLEKQLIISSPYLGRVTLKRGATVSLRVEKRSHVNYADNPRKTGGILSFFSKELPQPEKLVEYTGCGFPPVVTRNRNGPAIYAARIVAQLGLATALAAQPAPAPQDVKACAGDAASPVAAEQCYQLGLTKMGDSQPLEALQYFGRALAGAKELRYYLALGLANSLQMNWEESVRILDQAREEMLRRGDAEGQASVADYLSQVLSSSPLDGRTPRAYRLASESVAIRQNLPQSPDLGNSLSTQAAAARDLALEGWTIQEAGPVDCRTGACEPGYTLRAIEHGKNLAMEALRLNQLKSETSEDAARDAELLALLSTDLAKIYHAKALLQRQEERMRNGNEAAQQARASAAEFEKRRTGAVQDALKWFEQARKIDEANGNSSDPIIASAEYNLANVMLFSTNTKEVEDAAAKAERATELYSVLLGPIHTRVAAGKRAQGEALLADEQLTKARSVAQEALDIDTQILGEDHPDVARDKNLLGRIFLGLGLTTAAAPLLQQASTSMSQNFGSSYFESQKFQIDKGRFDSARKPRRRWWKYAAVAAAGVAVGVLLNGGEKKGAVIGIGGGGVGPP